MSEELRQYPPTPRRLEKLRQMGLAVSYAAVAAVLGLAAFTLAVYLAGDKLGRWAMAMLAHDLRAEAVRPAGLAGLLVSRLGAAALVIVAIAIVVAAGALIPRLAQGGVGQRSSKLLYLPMSDTRRGRRRRAGDGAIALGIAGLCCAGLIYVTWLGRLGEAQRWPGLEQLPAMGLIWLRWLAVLGGLATLHARGSWLRHLRQAQMTHREMLEERRETEGSWLKRRRRDTRDG